MLNIIGIVLSVIGVAIMTFDANLNMQVSPEAETLMLTTNENDSARALTMLIDNARKFARKADSENSNAADKHSVVLRVEKTAEFASFIVEDNGIGIPAEESEHIFDEFVQLDEYYEGTGIGLTVARSFARRLGGDVVLDTSFTDGARFVMTLPL